jgi:hypothetical protein
LSRELIHRQSFLILQLQKGITGPGLIVTIKADPIHSRAGKSYSAWQELINSPFLCSTEQTTRNPMCEGEKTPECVRRSGWSGIYSARFGVEGFFCRHMICPDHSDLPSPQQSPLEVENIDPSLLIEPLQVEWSFAGSADPQTSAAVLPDGEDVELEEQGFIGIVASECMVLSPEKRARSPLLIALAMDWKETIRDLDSPGSILYEIRSEFRCKCWISARANQIDSDTLQAWNET